MRTLTVCLSDNSLPYTVSGVSLQAKVQGLALFVFREKNLIKIFAPGSWSDVEIEYQK